MNENLDEIIKTNRTPLNTVLTGLITNHTFINIGIIKKVHNERYVDVTLYYNNIGIGETVIPDVRLLRLGTAKCDVYVEPEVGDNVLLLNPKDFIAKLEFDKKPEDVDTMVNQYSITGMCGLLISPENDHESKTTITIDKEGNITVTAKENTEINCEKDVTVNAKNIVANCKTLTVNDEQGETAAFEVKTSGE